MKYETTYHAGVERKNRLQALEEVLGFTNPVLEVVMEETKRYQLTSSGIIVVTNVFTNLLITAYMANYDQCYRLYKLAGKGEVAPKMKKRVMKNCERHPELFEIKC